jgi:hypothetical protein
MALAMVGFRARSPVMNKQISFDEVSGESAGDFDGPFLFCDYWASVLNLKEIVNLQSLSAAGLSLEIFRKILNRPSAGLPRLGYYILATLAKPFVVLFHGVLRLAGRRRKPAEVSYNRDAMRNLLVEHALKVIPKHAGTADVYSDDDLVASDVINPFRLRASASMFFARYKVFLASAVALGYGALLGPVTRLFGAENVLVPYLGVLFYPIVLLILWLMFDDLLTATIAPLPLIAITRIIRVSQGFKGFVIAVVLTAFVLYLVEWFFIPRSLPPALYFYKNDRDSKQFPYRPGHEPYWLEGTAYWIWRFVTLAPAELLKFWEKDWERLEVWVRADGPGKGRIEWIVTDWHYRELWYKYEVFAGERARAIHQDIMSTCVDSNDRLTWIIELDMDLMFHSPVVRGIYMARGRRPSIGQRTISILSAIVRKRRTENPEKYTQNLEMFEIQGGEFLDDVPEHFRMAAARRLLSLPWTYWRFPRGAKAAKTVFVYGRSDNLGTGPEFASDRKFQLKEPGFK